MVGDRVAALIRLHLQRYPAAEILDVYKLLHQAAFGPGHAIKNVRAAREWLERESDLLTPDASAPLVENIHPDAQIVRIHLRPYLAAGGKLNKLLDGFVQSSKTVTGDPTTLADWWATFQAMVDSHEFADHFNPRTVALESRTLAAQNWPAAQHSPNFERTYHPAYRVLAFPVAEAVLRQQKIPVSVI